MKISLRDYINLFEKNSTLSKAEIEKEINEYCISLFNSPKGSSFLRKITEECFDQGITEPKDIIELSTVDFQKYIPRLINNFHFNMIRFCEKNSNKLKSTLPIDKATNIDINSFSDYILDGVVRIKLYGKIYRWLQLLQKDNSIKTNIITTLDDLNDTSIMKGKMFNLDPDIIIDLNHRDSLFVYINGELYIGNSDNIHYELIQKYMNEHNIEEEGTGTFEQVRSLDDVPELKKINANMALGHGIQTTAYIEYMSNGVNLNSLINSLKQYYKKIYDYSYVHNTVTCLAKRIK